MKNKLLIVEGDDHYRTFLVDFFLTRDFLVTGCGSYTRAKETISADRFDIAIVDYSIGSESGKSFCNLIVSRFQKAVSLIIMSDAQSTAIELRIRSHAPDFYFIKPFTIDNLYAVVLKIMQARNKKTLLQRKALAV